MKKEILSRVCWFICYVLVLFMLSLAIYLIMRKMNFNHYAIAFLCAICSHWLIGEVLKIIKGEK